MRGFTSAAMLAAAIIASSAVPASGSSIGFCGGGSAPCTGVEILNVSGPHFSYDTGGQTVGPFQGEQAVTTPTSVGVAAINRVGGDSNDLAARVDAWFMMEPIVITGGTGTDTIFFDWSLDGTLSNGPIAGLCSTPNELGCTASVTYRYGGLFGPTITSASIPCCTSTTQTIDRSGSFGVTFTYGVPFTPQFYLQGFSGEGAASISFLSTGDVTGAILPFGATLTTVSGRPFGISVITVPSAVPEPSSVLLTLGGLVVLAVGRRRRRGRAQRTGSQD